jgi:oxalate decarboxylase
MTDGARNRFINAVPVSKDVSLASWMALTPKELVSGHFDLDDDVVKALRRERDAIV